MEGSKIDSWMSFKFSNEADFERIVLQKNLFKNLVITDAKVSLNNRGGYNRYGDLLIYSRDFQYWSIGETEIAEHSFDSHVFPQLLELFTLIEMNLDFIKSQFLKEPLAMADKNLRDLIQFNKPFLTLITDRFPIKHVSSLNMLRRLCNISVITRFKNDNEDYIYSHEEHLKPELESIYSYGLIRDNVLEIERPNLIGMQKPLNGNVFYNDQIIELSPRNHLVNGENRLFWVTSKFFRAGLYKLKKEENNIIISKK